MIQHFPAPQIRSLFPELPTSKHFGISQGNHVATAGYGLLGDFSDVGSYWSTTPTEGFDSGGPYLEFDTTATQQRSGWGSIIAITENSLNPKVFFKFRINPTTNMRVLMGLTGAGAVSIQTNNTPFANAEGFGLLADSAQANFQVIHNDGDASQNNEDTGIALSTGSRSFYFDVTEDGTRVDWYFWNTDQDVDGVAADASGTVTTELPVSTTDLFLNFLIYNTTAASKVLRRRSIIIKCDSG